MCLTKKHVNATIDQYFRVPDPSNPQELVGIEYKKKTHLRPAVQQLVIGVTRRTAADIRKVVTEHVNDPHARSKVLSFIDEEYRLHRQPSRPLELEV